MTAPPGDATDLAGRTFLVTGGNTGIGRATVTALARRGGRVYLACRSPVKGRQAAADVVAATGNDAVTFLPLDLADLASVRDCAAQFLARGEPLHALVKNAGVAGRRGVTKDGFELAFGVNHLGHFALTAALLGRLAESAPARVVTVSSDSHYQARGVDSARCAGPLPASPACASTRCRSCATCFSRPNWPGGPQAAASRHTRCTLAWWRPTSGGVSRGRCAR